MGDATVQHEQVWHASDNAPPDTSARCGASISRVVDRPPHHAITRGLAGRCDLEPQRIGDLTLQRMLGAMPLHQVPTKSSPNLQSALEIDP